MADDIAVRIGHGKYDGGRVLAFFLANPVPARELDVFVIAGRILFSLFALVRQAPA